MARILLPILLLLALCLNAQPVITNQPANQVVVWGSNATFSVMVTGIGPFTYQWRVNGTNLPNNIISTIAGGQLFDGLAATNVILNAPQGAAVDAAGNLYVADSFNNVIRKIGTNGVAKIVAGTGAGGFSGDGGPATNAMLFSPAAVILDAAGNLLVSDSGNNRVRKVSTNGIIATIVGNGIPPVFPGASAGNGGQATNANISHPIGLALDLSGNLYIADSSDNQIRKVDTGGIITCIANTGGFSGYNSDNISATSAYLQTPEGVAVDAAGNIYIADTFNYRIRKITVSNGRISTVAGTGVAGYLGDGGSATSARINYCYGVTVATNSNIFVADSGNHCIRKITNGIISTIAGTGTAGFAGDGELATNASLNLPGGVSLDISNNIFIIDEGNNRIRKIGTNGIIATVAGKNLNDGVAATNATLNFPIGVARDAAGNFFIADAANARIRKIDTNGIISTVAGSGAIGFSGDGAAATNASMNRPYSVAVDAAGNLFIADTGNLRVRKVDANGIISTFAGNGSFPASNGTNGQPATNVSMRPWGVAVDGLGNLFIADVSSVIRKVDTNGIITRVAGFAGTSGHSGDGGAATSALIASPLAVCLNQIGELFFAESGAIRKINTNGIITAFAGRNFQNTGYSGDGAAATNALISGSVWGLWCDSGGSLFFSDTSNQRIRKVNTDGIISTVAGNGSSGFLGDNGTAASAALTLPRGLVGDAAGNLYLLDEGNNRLRKISYLESANQPVFAVANVGLSSLSNIYSVVISSASGSVTSSVAVINLQLPPVTPIFSVNSNAISFTWSAVSNLAYQLQYATNLAAPFWQNLGGSVIATNNSVSTSDIPGADAQRFYRVQFVP